jgi:superfamily II DNA or RNA helicase
MIDQWNVFGKTGPVIFEKNSDKLREGKFVSQVKVDIVRISYNMTDLAELHRMMEEDSNKYAIETEFVINNKYRNKLICHTANISRGNTLIMVDRIAHGELLEEELKKITNKQVYFIQGSVDVDDREVIRELMENSHNVVCIAISKIFSTGINIKNIHNIIFSTPGKAKVKLIQSIGRGLRLHASKSILRVIDFADNLHYSSKHLEKRQKLYVTEKIKYEIRNIKQPNRKG